MTRLILTANKIYDNLLKINLGYQRIVPAMKDFIWEPWHQLPTWRKAEMIARLKADIVSEREFVSAADISRIHEQITVFRKGLGWEMGETKNYQRKTDPYLQPMRENPEWLFSLCLERDMAVLAEAKKLRPC